MDGALTALHARLVAALQRTASRPASEVVADYLRGRIGLAHSLLHFMETGEPVPPELVQAWRRVMYRYEFEKLDDLGLALGIERAPDRTRSMIHRVIEHEEARRIVKHFQAEGFPITTGSYKKTTAYEMAAMVLDCSVHTVRARYKGRGL